jgi:hypothetical protein
MIRTWSLVVAVVGILATGAAVRPLQSKTPGRELRHYWFLGLGALFPAWLIAFLGLLQPATEQPGDVPLPPPALLSSGAALLGLIATDYLLRRLQKPGANFPAAIWWLLGCLALVPAWMVLILSL